MFKNSYCLIEELPKITATIYKLSYSRDLFL